MAKKKKNNNEMESVVAVNPDSVNRSVSLDDSKLYINRELSWLKFNERVLDEALDKSHPLLERTKFLSIFGSNLDEFFMVRVSGLRRQLAATHVSIPADGMTPAEQLTEIRREVELLLERSCRCWVDELVPGLKKEGIRIRDFSKLSSAKKEYIHRFFYEEVFSTLTPMAFDSARPFPHIYNLSLNLAVGVRTSKKVEQLAMIRVPTIFPRLVRVPGGKDDDLEEMPGLEVEQGNEFVWLEQVIAANLEKLFPGLKVTRVHPFRVTRDADFEIQEDDAADLLEAIKEGVERREFGSSIRLEVGKNMPAGMREELAENIGIAPYLVYAVEEPLGVCDIRELTGLDRPDLKYPPFAPKVSRIMLKEESVINVLRERDVLFHHPYDSFTPVVDFLREAATDPNVLAIKQTLYRVDAESPIINALMKAGRERKQVAVLVELKARFDEVSNIAWAEALEKAGVHVIYGIPDLKTHAKMLMVVRKETDGIVRYVHLSTGNYNAITSWQYTDMGIMTRDPDITEDIAELFNALTGFSKKKKKPRKLLIAPGNLRNEIIMRIDREVQRQKNHGDGYLALKMNSLVDKQCIMALYRASRAGVPIDLQVRGICCLRPGVPGVSETITVTSIVGRFLEHTRIYYFRNGGDEEEVFLGSADLMPRNLNNRVEILFPVEQPNLKTRILTDILHVQLHDNVKARQLRPDGTYERIEPGKDEERIDAQEWQLRNR